VGYKTHQGKSKLNKGRLIHGDEKPELKMVEGTNAILISTKKIYIIISSQEVEVKGAMN